MSQQAVRVAVSGASGRMGRTLIAGVLDDTTLTLGAAFDLAGQACIGEDAGQLIGAAATGVLVRDDVAGALPAADVLIDFTRPAGTLQYLAACVQAKRAIVIGTTGFSAAEKKQIAAAAQSIPIVFAPNMAVGVNVTFKLAQIAARALGDDYDVEIIESHHRHKVDAPSGTALRFGEVVAQALGRDPARDFVHGRHGEPGARPAKEIAFHAIRGGDIIGEHTVMFAGMGERVEVTVRSSSRSTYAAGALRAARFVAGRAAGLYDMDDVLGLK